MIHVSDHQRSVINQYFRFGR